MTVLNARNVHEALKRLCVARADTFGANVHRFQLNDPLPEQAVLAFEKLYDVTLPLEYRHFITMIGDGGAGPFYGVFPLGKWDGSGSGLEDWREGEGLIGVLPEPFPFDQEWNDLRGKPPDELLESDEEDYERQFDAFEKRYWGSSILNGAIPICHEGCALRIWLVLTGDQRGRIWRDTRAEYTGLKPLCLSHGTPATFSSWYREWLEDALGNISV